MSGHETIESGGAPARRRRRVRFFLLYFVYLVVLGWIGTRLFWLFAFNVPMTDEMTVDDVWMMFYREVYKTGVRDAPTSSDDRYVDVLVLGGSVMDQAAPSLESALRERLGDRLRFFNLAKPAHTSRDSLLKLRLIRDRSFDLIVVYNSMNDVAMNCVPESEFRDDYTHCTWYASIRDRVAAGKMSLGRLAADRLQLIARSAPAPDEIVHGGIIKTDRALEANLTEIVGIASEHDTPVILMTFATYIAPNYSKEAFVKDELDYGKGRDHLPIEVWGLPDHVKATMAAHNRRIQSVAGNHPNVILVDQDKRMPRGGEFFSDVCHLTEVGNETFVNNMAVFLDVWVDSIE